MWLSCFKPEQHQPHHNLKDNTSTALNRLPVLLTNYQPHTTPFMFSDKIVTQNLKSDDSTLNNRRRNAMTRPQEAIFVLKNFSIWWINFVSSRASSDWKIFQSLSNKIYSLQDLARLSSTPMHSTCKIHIFLQFFLQDGRFCSNLARFSQNSC